MSARIPLNISTPIRENLTSVSERWDGPDKGMIYCWEQGRREAQAKPDLAARARDGELTTVGSVSDDSLGVWKRGTLQYLAWWQGLRGDDLCIDFKQEIQITCTKTEKTYAFPLRNKNPDY